jgi:DNA-binding MarR family transcriptional regulator
MNGDDALARFAAAMGDDISRLLLAASRTLNNDALAAIDPDHSSGVRLAHVPLIAALDGRGTRLVDLAARMGVTRQAVAALARDLEASGHVSINPDPQDHRAQRVVLTDKGIELCERAADYLESRERLLREIHGETTVDEFKALLRDLAKEV